MPVVRPDVNGKLVTRHVRATQAPTAVALPLPRVQQQEVSGPSIEAAKGRRTLLRALTVGIVPQHEVPFQRHTTVELKSLVLDLPDSTVEAFHAAFNGIEDKTEKTFLFRMMMKAMDCETSSVDIESAIHYFVNSDSTVRDEIDEFFEVGVKELPDYPIGNLIRGLKAYKLDGFSFDPDMPIGRQSERTVEQCMALKELHYAANQASHWELNSQRLFANDQTLLEPRLAQIVVDNPEATESIIEIIDERETLDYDLITSIMGSDATALRGGTL